VVSQNRERLSVTTAARGTNETMRLRPSGDAKP
jgi:hypothetical protein